MKLVMAETLAKVSIIQKEIVIEARDKEKKAIYKRRPPVDKAMILRLKEEGHEWSGIAKICGISKSTVGRVIVKSYRERNIPKSNRGRKRK